MFKKMLLGLSACLAFASTSIASGLDSATLTTIQDGISGADTNYYAVGGTILVVLAGVWGFRLIMRLVR